MKEETILTLSLVAVGGFLVYKSGLLDATNKTFGAVGDVFSTAGNVGSNFLNDVGDLGHAALIGVPTAVGMGVSNVLSRDYPNSLKSIIGNKLASQKVNAAALNSNIVIAANAQNIPKNDVTNAQKFINDAAKNKTTAQQTAKAISAYAKTLPTTKLPTINL